MVLNLTGIGACLKKDTYSTEFTIIGQEWVLIITRKKILRQFCNRKGAEFRVECLKKSHPYACENTAQKQDWPPWIP